MFVRQLPAAVPFATIGTPVPTIKIRFAPAPVITAHFLSSPVTAHVVIAAVAHVDRYAGNSDIHLSPNWRNDGRTHRSEGYTGQKKITHWTSSLMLLCEETIPEWVSSALAHEELTSSSYPPGSWSI
jgi:hypothetical protein